ncbi:MAG TPA: outer membrane protein assembly factor BamA [Terriglobales bacterium]|nr:outer membrane protein assembly factor BamA [Terriglobales bacterium]
MRSTLRQALTTPLPRISLMIAAWFLMALALSGLASAQSDLISDIVIHGNRRIPAETIRARMSTHRGDVYDQQALERDFNSLWNTGYFQDLRFEREESPKGWIINVYVKEKPTIREIKYLGLNSVSQSDVLDRFKERKVGLSQESQYDPTKVKLAEVVIKELLAEHGRQFATIKTEIRQIPPAAVSVTFNVKEGPKVKVGKIIFEGNNNLNARYLRSSMKNLKPIGIPHSIFLENLFAKTYDASKLNEDAERVRDAYQQKGYFKALVQDPKTHIRDTTSIKWYPPFGTKHGKAVDITLPIEEGDKYTLKEIKFTGNKALSNTAALRRIIPMKDGDIFNVEMMRKGLKNLRDAYGEYGYINFTPVPNMDIDDEHRTISVTFDLDEGAQFFVRRIEFKGNTTTRDKVIRRELALEEGGIYNKKLWDLSLLRLNQLGYFEPLKPEDQGGNDTETKVDNQNHTVDLTLKVKEKGKNSIGLSGGVSGLEGSFIGLNYSTNNFLGLGETLSVQAQYGSIARNISFGFTQPYLFDRPLQFGFTVFTSKYNYNQVYQNQLYTGQQVNLPQNVLQSLQNYSQSTTGFTVSASYPLHRSFKRVGMTYALSTSSLQVYSQFSALYFEQLNFRNVSGPNALDGIITSALTPNFSFNTIDSPQHPHRGHSFYSSMEISGLGGNTAAIRPVVEWKQFIPMKGIHPKLKDPFAGKQALGYRIQGSYITGYNGYVAPPFQRFYLGGDTDLRGFDTRSVTPIAYFVEVVNAAYTNPDGTAIPLNPNNTRQGTWTVPVPVRRLIYPGGDTSLVTNVEYRIPIAGPVTLAPFTDFGFNGVSRPSQLQINEQQYQALTQGNFGCPTIDANFNCTGTISGSTLGIKRNLYVIPGTNWQPRMSTGVELQVIMPIVNAPFRIYYAYNPLRIDTYVTTPTNITRSMFPATEAGTYSYLQAQSIYSPGWLLREPRKTFRFTVSTTF